MVSYCVLRNTVLGGTAYFRSVSLLILMTWSWSISIFFSTLSSYWTPLNPSGSNAWWNAYLWFQCHSHSQEHSRYARELCNWRRMSRCSWSYRTIAIVHLYIHQFGNQRIGSKSNKVFKFKVIIPLLESFFAIRKLENASNSVFITLIEILLRSPNAVSSKAVLLQIAL